MNSTTLTLKHVTLDSCPTCGSKIRVIEIGPRQHSNGEYPERVEFFCGSVHEYSPAFYKVRAAKRCPRNPTQITIDAFRKGLEQKLKNVMAKTVVNFPVPADDVHLQRELETALKHIRVELDSAISMSVMRKFGK